ncbi:MAG: hypothetical protein KGL39_25715 [Patescibacteria group bacterium]|nr:hypothetical protein [Patescibacteria group bacterium]
MPQRRTNAEIALLLAAKIAQQAERAANKGLQAALPFLASRVREAVSIPAPRRAVRGAPAPGKKKGAILYYVATRRAIPGAPPRKLSGKLRQSIWHKMVGKTRGLIGANARSYGGFNYPAALELSKRINHPFIKPTVLKFRSELARIAGRPVRVEFQR